MQKVKYLFFHRACYYVCEQLLSVCVQYVMHNESETIIVMIFHCSSNANTCMLTVYPVYTYNVEL